MKFSDVEDLVPGLYRLTFHREFGGNTALAVVGEFWGGGRKMSRWWVTCNQRIDASKSNNWSNLVSTSWESVEKALLIRSPEADQYIQDAKALTISAPLPPVTCEIVRDLFLTGQDVDAIAVMARELGMSQPQDADVAAAVSRVLAAAVYAVDHLDGGRLAGWRDRERATELLRKAVKEWRGWQL